MNEKLQTALNNADMVYDNLVVIANEIVEDYTGDIDSIISETTSNVENLSVEQIRQLILKLSLKSFAFSSVKEKAALKAECAETLRKEAYAREFAGAEGAVAAKENLATVKISNEVLVESIYNLVSSLFKTKLDELHRVVDALKSVLMSKMQETKLMASFSEGE